MIAAANASTTSAQVYSFKSQREESPRNPQKTSLHRLLSETNAKAKAKPESTHNSLKVLDISELNVNTNNASPKDCHRVQGNRDEVSRQGSVREHVGTLQDNPTTSSKALKRTGTQRSLDDRFGSMFDIQRSAQYYVSQERTTFHKIREICARLAKSSSFINFTMAVILINTITMATEHYEQVR